MTRNPRAPFHSTGLSQQVKGRDRTVLKTLSQYGSAMEGLMETTKVSSLRLFLMSSLFRFVLRHTCRHLYTETIGDVWSQSLETTKHSQLMVCCILQSLSGP
ncbi:hypothetical protein ILYODFUR_018995 [Ilyodon furcidens]|uniref:Uncharacterized protein n=1 Tax=Ilyodon furcidens TaxID=33524 RepID=A0ABV0UAG3_9TELE